MKIKHEICSWCAKITDDFLQIALTQFKHSITLQRLDHTLTINVYPCSECRKAFDEFIESRSKDYDRNYDISHETLMKLQT